MKSSVIGARIALLAASCLCGFFLATACSAQVQTTGGQPGAMQQLNSRSNVQQILQVQGKEDEDYTDFTAVKPQDLDKKIKLGENFLGKYPNSKYAEQVDVGLMNAYYAKQDWKNFYASADRALALRPDEVDVLVTFGWVISHRYDSHDPDAAKLLGEGETYEMRAISDLESMTKPPEMKEVQFSDFKAQKSIQAHSALGLIYFRHKDYENTVKELQQATQSNKSPDQTDLMVLGTSLDQLNRHAEAADSFDKCGQIAGSLQDRCKQFAIAERNQSAQPK
ncbi:MAG TPA: hypothetical protein VMM16_08790 [Verrucomicrobiae bacterium]|nr:hypothetical protein [Verrucomicrobiae bacterium]